MSYVHLPDGEWEEHFLRLIGPLVFSLEERGNLLCDMQQLSLTSLDGEALSLQETAEQLGPHGLRLCPTPIPGLLSGPFRIHPCLPRLCEI